MSATQPAAPDPRIRVSTLELFFDLVFVFTITQLAETFYEHLNLATLGNVVLILAVVWWMYSGYAWLTNAIAPNSTTRRTLLLTGMAGFLVMALAIPEAFGEYGWLFGAGYLVVNLVHGALFWQAGTGARQAMRLTTPLNIVAAVLVLAGGLLPEPWRHLCWVAAPLIQITAGYLHRDGLHPLAAGHLVERHGLVVIIAIGESIVAIGVGLRGGELGAGAILVAVLGLCIAYYLWWFYFAGDDERAEQVLSRTPPSDQGRLALHSYGYAHIPMMLGIVVLAAGVHHVGGHPFDALHWGEALTLSGGVALYLVGHAAFLWVLGLHGVLHRLAAAAAVLAVIPLGHVAAIAQLAALPIIMAATAIIEDLPELRRTGRTEISTFGRTTKPAE
jgi:low temperature requirement protein LtrA